jgi:pilus assembly protein CpaF
MTVSLYERLSKARGEGPTALDESGHADQTVRLDQGASGGRAQRSTPYDPLTDLKRKIHAELLQSLGPKLYDLNMTPEQLEVRVRTKLTEVLEQDETPLSAADRQRLVSETTDDILGYGPLEPFLRDPTVTEIMVNGHNTVYIERQGKIERTGASFLDDAHLRRTIDKIVGRVGRRIDESQPYVDARLPDGSRVNAAISPISIDGALLTIRKFARDPFQVEDLISFGTFTPKVARFLDACVKGRMNVLVSGGTGSGKSSGWSTARRTSRGAAR